MRRGPRVAAHTALDEPDLDLHSAMIRIQNTVLELIEFTRPRGERTLTWPSTDAGADHLASAGPDIAAAHRRLTDAGMEFVAEPYTFTAEDGAPDVVGAAFAYSTDPHGLRLEIFQPARPPDPGWGAGRAARPARSASTGTGAPRVHRDGLASR